MREDIDRGSGPPASTGGAPPPTSTAPLAGEGSELRRRRDALAEQVTELHWDLGGLAYEMAIRDHFRLDVLVRRAAALQERDGELAEARASSEDGGRRCGGALPRLHGAAQQGRALLLAVRIDIDGATAERDRWGSRGSRRCVGGPAGHQRAPSPGLARAHGAVNGLENGVTSVRRLRRAARPRSALLPGVR